MSGRRNATCQKQKAGDEGQRHAMRWHATRQVTRAPAQTCPGHGPGRGIRTVQARRGAWRPVRFPGRLHLRRAALESLHRTGHDEQHVDDGPNHEAEDDGKNIDQHVFIRPCGGKKIPAGRLDRRAGTGLLQLLQLIRRDRTCRHGRGARQPRSCSRCWSSCLCDRPGACWRCGDRYRPLPPPGQH